MIKSLTAAALSLFLSFGHAQNFPTQSTSDSPIDLRENQVLKLSFNLFKSFDQITEENPSLTVGDFVDLSLKVRAQSLAEFESLQFTIDPILRPLWQKIHTGLQVTPELRSQLDSALAQFGEERIPLGPVPLPREIYEVWEPRFKVLGRLGLRDVFGSIGELAVATSLPRLMAVNVGPSRLFSPKEYQAFFQNLSPEDRNWISNFKGQNQFEIDVVYDNGETLGEVKFIKYPIGFSHPLYKKIKRQAKRLRKLTDLLQRHGIRKNAKFIVVGAEPGEAVENLISEAGLTLVKVPFDFGDTGIRRVYSARRCSSAHLLR